MRKPRSEDRARRLMGIPVPEPVTSVQGLRPQHQIVLNHWFENGCRSKRAACIAAGFHPNSVSQIWSHPAVQKDIERRRLRIDFRSEDITEERIIAEFAKIAFSNLGDLLEIQEDGSAWVDLSSITDAQKAALSEYNVETYQVPGQEDEGGYTVKKSRIKFHDKQAALIALARIKGMLKDKLEIAVGLSLSEKVQQRRERLAVSRDTVIEGEIVK